MNESREDENAAPAAASRRSAAAVGPGVAGRGRGRRGAGAGRTDRPALERMTVVGRAVHALECICVLSWTRECTGVVVERLDRGRARGGGKVFNDRMCIARCRWCRVQL